MSSFSLRRAALLVALLLAGVIPSAAVLAERTVITPPAFTGLLTNPGIGVASFHDGYGQKPSLKEYPDTGFEYDRFYWSDLEPEEGVYDFAPIDRAFSVAARHQPAMNVGLRFMALDEPQSGSKIPAWLIKKGIQGQWVENGKTFVPDLSDPTFIAYAQKLLNALGARYDGNPNLGFVDIGMVGSWGEWHNSNFPDVAPLLEKYAPEQLNRYVDMHFSSFPKTPKIMLISGGNSLAWASQKGAGWRADCWGDWHNFSAEWSHMRDDYPQRLAAAQTAWSGFNDSWQHAPVSLEICGYMAEWESVQHYTREEVQASFDWALAQHASTLNLKSRPVPAAYRDIVDSALLRIGYRYRVGQMEWDTPVRSGMPLTLNVTWRNDGVAPAYLPYLVQWRIVNDAGTTVTQIKTADDVRQWLPGDHHSSATLPLPAGLPGGQYRLEAALTNYQGQPRIQLANEGKTGDGWYSLASFNLKE
ncbi:TPA: DUF4832 domain-containing protein [Klebsiella michiganensis]|uniref:DUF4832 domain-containing protein n=1 Tax=Klebsiella TaxID=570 RepID=UPI000469D20E|nr:MULTISPECIES: DUF4832 domain-containing protein [Klebsiella]QLX17111.1 DUF4832 domain-containing protein [Klebsiella oxytoca]AWF53786.1 beta-galactosidase family protein [Klebsiella michiganensis]EKQ6534921.1 DUF4832 domain-containing protein [Klebsiella michiganensis]ELQ7987080.1 DUF4832 domain-containing protein [Klebsiella michiganensis]ELQ7991666.1 DUF4832 domain-containing protein [Klebsiella michiganensis]